MAKFIGQTGLVYLWGKIKTWVGNYVKITSSTGKDTITAGNNSVDIYDWAQASTKPSYTASEVGALPDSTEIPDELADLSDDSTHRLVTDTEKSTWNGKQDAIDSSHKLSADLIEDGTTNKAYTADEKTKLSGISAGAEVNQNAFSNVKVGSSTVAADGKTDTLELAVASNSVVSLTADTTNDKVTFDVDKDLSKYDNSTAGFITSADVPEGAAASTTTPKMDGTAAKGTDNGFARGDHVHPTDTSRVAANAAITGATKTKITYDSKGLVTAGADLAASDIPSITLSKISDVTASASELNIMDGVTASTEELNLLDGVTATTTELNYVDGVTSNIQTQLDNKVGTSSVGAANGVCPLDANTKIDAQYLPSYVDDVIEAYIRTGQTALSSTWLATGSASGTVITPQSGVIYVLMNSSTDYPENTQFRWGGTAYVKLNDGGISEMTTSEMDTATSNWT